MEARITYIYHSCFTLEYDDKVILFDYPSESFSPNGTKEIVQNITEHKELYVFFSHGHRDHFTTSVDKFSKFAETTHLIISNDISTGLFSSDSDVVQVVPNSDHRIDDIDIHTFESNDKGVAYLIRIKGRHIYFGGDLAKWNWPEWSPEKRKEHVDVFENVLVELKEKNIEIAFSNMDERLSSWAGPDDFINTVKPENFVPIHTFGNPEWIEDLVKKLGQTNTNIIEYDKIGDGIKLNI